MKKLLNIALILFTFAITATAQQRCNISGKVIDAKTSEALIGCSIRLDEGAGGATTDLDGNFIIGNATPGKHKITISYLGYQTKTIENIDAKASEAVNIDIILEESTSAIMTEVVIVAQAQRESMSALTILQKNSAVVADGISAEVIKRTPDRNAGEVIRRVSGASIQDGRFAVIRGLNDRYNVALINGSLLSSTEPDRRAFSFDIFPSALLDNLIIMKTASPDLPGEFAGGAILMNTKDIPESNFLRVSVNTGANFLTTGKPFTSGSSSSRDWLGLGADSRQNIPSVMPDRRTYINLPKDEQYRISQQFTNDWSLNTAESARPNMGFQLTGGRLKKFGGQSLIGVTTALTYNNTMRTQIQQRSDYDLDKQLLGFSDEVNNNSVLWGALMNVTGKINNNNKVSVQATFTNNSDNQVTQRSGIEFEEGNELRSNANEYTATGLLTTRLAGEHALTQKGMKANWAVGYNFLDRQAPNQRRMQYSRMWEDGVENNDPYIAYVPLSGSADPYKSGRVDMSLGEHVRNANADLAIPFSVGDNKQIFKVGGLFQGKNRNFEGRLMGFIGQNPIRFFTSGIPFLPQDSIFRPENIGTDKMVIDEITNLADRYDAQSNLSAGFAMFDNKFGKLRAVWGLRYESFQQSLNSYDYQLKPVSVNRTSNALLPSFNLVYAVNEKSNLRLSGSKTISRPEFRELAPFAFFDFVSQTLVYGNPALTSADIYNADLRYEIYPGMNQLFSVSAFYKYFNNPIEQALASSGATTRERTFRNVPFARNYGIELEIRKNAAFLGEWGENIVAFTNLALIRSTVDLTGVTAADATRPLQGQSPYVFNAGLQYSNPDLGFNTTLVYNIIGDRIFEVGTIGYNDIYERHRNLLDWSVSKKIGERMEVRFVWSDIWSPDLIFYQDNNFDGRYQARTGPFVANDGNDNLIQRVNLASSVGLTLNWRF